MSDSLLLLEFLKIQQFLKANYGLSSKSCNQLKGEEKYLCLTLTTNIIKSEQQRISHRKQKKVPKNFFENQWDEKEKSTPKVINFFSLNILLQQRQNQIYAKRLNTKKRLQSRYEKAYNLWWYENLEILVLKICWNTAE